MGFLNMRRDPQAVHAALAEKDGALIAKQALRIYVPKRFESKRLVLVGSEVSTIGIFAIVVGDVYGVSKALAQMQLTPSSIAVVDMDGDDCFEFSFDKGAVICPNVNLIREDSLAFKVYDEIIAGGHIPSFLNMEDMAKLFDTSEYHAGIRLAPTNAPLEMIAAAISRDRQNMAVYWRQTAKSMADQKTNPPKFIAFRNVIWGATNTTARLMGSYFEDGMMSALVNPSEKSEPIETLLRS